MARFAKLHVTPGTDEINFDKKSYRPDVNGDVVVPVEAVDDLLSVGGCVAEDLTDPLPKGDVLVRHVGGTATSVSAGGRSCEIRPDGLFAVPVGSLADLAAHGFVGVEAIVESTPVEAAEESVAPVAVVKKSAVPQLKISK